MRITLKQIAARLKKAYFVVAGDSKRGWTSLLSSATDPRVDAVIPIAWDAINWNPHFDLHEAIYGGFTPSWDDYEDFGILSSLSSFFLEAPAAQGWARTTVLSSMMFSISGSLTKC